MVQWYFRYWFGRRSVDGKKQIARWKGIVSRFKDKLVQMFVVNLMTISPKIKQILLHGGYELAESDLL